ncbi:FAD-binding protein [bacterium CG17_big_fil_post_rev_8_21_14_2_50_64_8]|nr:MAG: FAD-binding protein [bacterium CG17_big_fil_post_rev_8_21_14_2_50_64_8]PJA74503.1 MAG: FAD-binding protein [bacterium CG_4_9_14_3_um_filter_65_15]
MTKQLYLKPRSAAEAAALLAEHRRAVIIGGGAYVRLGSRRIDVAVDLYDAGLDYVRRTPNGLELGAMATFRMLETAPELQDYADGILVRCVERIVGVQVRNITTVGGTLFGRYGFSNLITALLALDAEVALHHAGRMPLGDFLATKPDSCDLLTAVFLPDQVWRASWQDMTRTVNDYAVLNVAAARCGDQARVVVGARPGRGVRCPEAEAALLAGDADGAAEVAASTLEFGNDVRAGGDYRRELCRTLVARATAEVLA